MNIHAGIVVACSALLALQTPAVAKTAFDGSWRVTTTTTEGSCERVLHYRIVIIDGRVMSGDVNGVSGSVAASGKVSVTVRRKDGTAVGTGRLGASSGGGRWTVQSSSSGRCAGDWQADRVP